MDNLIGRVKEKRLLTTAFESESAEMLVIFGRRRIGKTFLVEKFFESLQCSFFQVIGVRDGSINSQLGEFAKEIGRVFYGDIKIEQPKTWMQAFEALNNAITFQKNEQKIVLFFDEFPWMVTRRSRLLQALEYYWNKYWKNNQRVKLIICGSSASWIVRKIIYNKGGLHNRITQKINLKPLNLSETALLLKQRGFVLDAKQVLEIYCAFGGVPHYLNQLKKNLSVVNNINNLCFQSGSLLVDEFDKLLSSLFEDSETYEELIRVIAYSRHGISREDVEASIKQTKKGGTLTKRLNDLEMAGFIKAFLPMGHSKKGLYYRVIDEYTLFFLQWIEPERNNIELDIDNNNLWLHKIKSATYAGWLGYAFESVCYKHVSFIKQALGIHVPSKIGSWRYIPRKHSKEHGAQVDLLFDKEDNSITLCEIKCSTQPFKIDKSYADELARKMSVFRKVTRTNKQIFLAIISANGVKPTLYSKELLSDVVILNDLFKE